MRQNEERRQRAVEFMVVSETHSGEQPIAEIGMQPDEVQSGSGRFAHEVAWVLRAVGDSRSDPSELVEDLLVRVEPFISQIEQVVSTSGDVVVLRVIQYISEDDPVGPGFSLNVAVVQTLARVRAMIDVDQYITVGRSQG
jgi:hypothetical protein